MEARIAKLFRYAPGVPGLEKGQANFRCLSASIFSLYLLGLYFAGWRDEVYSIVPAILGYFAFCISQVISTRLSPAFSRSRCVLAIVLDQLCIAWLILSSGGLGAPFAFTPAVASIGHGQRHGANYAYISCVISLVIVSVTVYVSPFWSEFPFIAGGVVLTACCLPAYAAALSTRLARDKLRMEAKALEMEKVAEDAQARARQHREELAHVARLSTMGEMASGIAHEINQPLGAILSYNQACIRMLQEADGSKDEIVRGMTMAAEQAKRAAEIIERLRSFLRKKAVTQAPVNLNEVITNALTLIELGLKDHQVVVETDLTIELPNVFADCIQLEQVVLNITRNAIDAMKEFSPDERRLRISTIATNNEVMVSISDNGPGIPVAVLPKLFHPFFTTKADGMGLGLVISQSIVEAFGGRITAHNLPGRGAVFQFSFPAYGTR